MPSIRASRAKRRGIWLAAGLGALACALAVSLTLGLGRRPSLPEAPQPTTVACRLKVGDELAFRVRSLGTSRGVAGAAGADNQVRKAIELGAVMHWRVLSAKGSGWLVAGALEQVTLQQPSDDMGASAPQVAAGDLADPFVIEMGRDCRFKETGFGPRAESAARAQIEALIGSVEVVLPIMPVPKWTARQRDGIGEYLGHYERDPGGGSVKRRRTAYLRMHSATAGGPAGARPQMKVLASEAVATPDAEGRWLTSFVGEDRMQVLLAERPVAEVSLRVELAQIDADPLSRLQGLALEQFIWGRPSEPGPARSTPKAATAAVAALDLSGALASFGKRLEGRGSAYHDAVTTLAGYLAARPDAIAELMARLRAGTIDSKLRAGLFLALEMTGTPAAERALADAVMDRGLIEVDRMRAAAALADVPRPSQQAVAALMEGARQASEPDVASTALLALGTLGRNAATAQPALTAEVREHLKTRLAAGAAQGDTLAALDAAGNLGDAALSAAVVPYTTNPSAKVRARAAGAFRRTSSADDEKLLIAWLAREPEASVRRAIIQALAERVEEAATRTPSSELLAAVIARLPLESDVQTRGLLIQLLGSAASAVPAAKQALIDQFKRESNVELLRKIGEFCTADELG